MEDVIVGLLFVFFFVIRPILKQARKAAQKGEGAEKAKTKAPGRRRKQISLSELFAKAQEKLRELAEQAEAEKRAKAEQPGRSAGSNWEDLFSGPAREPDPWEVEAGSSGDEQADGAGGWDWEPAPVTAQPVSPPPLKESEPPPLKPAVSPVPGLSPRRRLVRTGVDLRQAVIWSEILGPPVSLRE